MTFDTSGLVNTLLRGYAVLSLHTFTVYYCTLNDFSTSQIGCQCTLYLGMIYPISCCLLSSTLFYVIMINDKFWKNFKFFPAISVRSEIILLNAR